ncbi:MAG TPA: hypothetical protein VEB21_21275 [Terriglobales bacterium]|nr:hypothetical protein [Terriglobales bacterium]
MRRMIQTLLALSLMVAPAAGQTLYAANGGGGVLSTLYILDPTDGAVVSTVGPIGFSITGLAYDVTSGTLYGSTGNNPASDARSLVSIDTTTGAGTLIGPSGVDTPMADLTFDPAGTLYGWSGFSGTRGLYSIDPATGAATLVGSNTGRLTFVDGNGLASNVAGEMFGAATDDSADSAALFSVDPSTAISTMIATLTGMPGSADASVSALAFNSSGILYGAVQNFSSSLNGFDSFLVTINTSTGAVTTLGQTFDRLDAIAFVPSGVSPAPSMSLQVLTMLAAMLIAAGVLSVTRRAR